jgi:hypothetical protein
LDLPVFFSPFSIIFASICMAIPLSDFQYIPNFIRNQCRFSEIIA